MAEILGDSVRFVASLPVSQDLTPGEVLDGLFHLVFRDYISQQG